MNGHFSVFSHLTRYTHRVESTKHLSFFACSKTTVKYKISEAYVESKNTLGGSFRLFIIALDTYLRNNV